MLDQGYISQSEYEEALEDDVYARIQTTNQEKGVATVFSYYVDATVEQVINDLQEVKGYTAQQAYNLVYMGGLTIVPFLHKRSLIGINVRLGILLRVKQQLKIRGLVLFEVLLQGQRPSRAELERGGLSGLDQSAPRY